MKRIYRKHTDTKVTEVSVQITCPYCGGEWLEPDLHESGETYVIYCDGCEQEFEMLYEDS